MDNATWTRIDQSERMPTIGIRPGLQSTLIGAIKVDGRTFSLRHEGLTLTLAEDGWRSVSCVSPFGTAWMARVRPHDGRVVAEVSPVDPVTWMEVLAMPVARPSWP